MCWGAMTRNVVGPLEMINSTMKSQRYMGILEQRGSIDYNGYGVLPMAIDLNIELLVAPTTQSRIEFRNCQPDKYK
ncbi:unnamed protein product, partial [Mesorhabditis belari]|uniref:Galactokinase N-terminal domain-containing protein n=1 Tax=Mesorhabditis belari TaxID=2138241 RepID=A0AAF3EXC4_9BILA